MNLARRAGRRWGWLLLAAGASLAGCAREHYRIQADREAAELVAEKSNDPRWGLPEFSIAIDPRSRYYDPYDPDHPPMPPDDPAAHELMRRVGGMRGYQHWLKDGVRSELENPDWRQRLGEYAPLTEDGKVILSLDTALRLARIHSPDYQNQLETLYLSALDVSAERFRFQTQFFGGNDSQWAHSGRLRSPGGERNTLTTDTDAQLRRRFATAGELLVGFANSFVWQFAGPDTNSALSIASFSLIQPLLRGAGRDVVLERLTIVERVLLSNLRAFQRYRQGFFTRIAIGDSGVSGPQRRGGFFGGTGLTGFTGTGAGGLGGVGGATNFGRAGFGAAGGGGVGGAGGLAGGGAGRVGGFIGLLQQLQEIRNQQDSFDLQRRTLALLEANLEAGLIDLTQVDQFRQSIETQRAQLLQARNGLQNAIENFLTGTIGLPASLPVQLDDSFIRPFQFIDPQITAVQNQLAALQEATGELPLAPEIDALNRLIDQARTMHEQGHAHFQTIRHDLELLEQRSPEREAAMNDAEREEFRRTKQQLAENYKALEQRFAEAAKELQELNQRISPDNRQAVADQFVVWMRQFGALMQETALLQARARLESIVLQPLELSPEDALWIARANRLDLMNNRAALVDTWRLIAFNADALQSDLDLTFGGDIRTLGDNPAKFRAPTGSFRVGVQFDGPFTRLLERNNYRQALIDYQRDRRRLIQFEDGIERTLRQLLRQLEEHRVNLEIQRRAVAISIRRVDFTEAELNKPLPVPQPGQPQPSFGPTAVQNLLSALADLSNSQNNFMSVWLNYYATRMLIMRELGVMELDEEGRWIDKPLEALQADPRPDLLVPPALPEAWIRQGFPEGMPAELVERNAPPTAPPGPDAPAPAATVEPHGPEQPGSPSPAAPAPHQPPQPAALHQNGPAIVDPRAARPPRGPMLF